MKSGDIYICNICSLKSSDDENAVFIKAHKNGELHEITQHIHGDDARSTDRLELTKELSGRLKSTVEELHAWREKITTIPLQEQDRQQVGV